MMLQSADRHRFFTKQIMGKKKSSENQNGPAQSYNQYKLYNGKQYSGMKVGRSHKWYYDQGIWLDKKITPDKWLISYEVTKRRAGKAPKGSGVPVGTEYHWYILAHQKVKKLDANSYSTAMNGFKFKLAHKRSEKRSWNISDAKQRKQLIRILRDFIEELENEPLEEFVNESNNTIRKAVKKTSSGSVKRKKVAEPA